MPPTRWDVAPAGPTTDDAPTLEALRRQNDLLRQTIVLCDRLTTMALRGEGVASITAGFSRMLGHGVALLDPMLSPLASSRWNPEPTDGSDPLGLGVTAARLREVLAGSRGPLRLPALPGSPAGSGCVIAPVNLGARLLGYVAVASTEEPVAGDLDLFAVQHAATVYAQALLEADRVDAFRLRFRREIFESLLHGHASGHADAAESARLIGLDPDKPFQVLAISPCGAGGLETAAVLETVAAAIGRRWPELLAVNADEDLIVVGPPRLSPTGATDRPGGGTAPPTGGTSKDEETGACLLGYFQNRFPATTFVIGASRVTATLGELAAAHDQARATRKLAEALGRAGEVTAYTELGFYRLLLAVPPAELAGFADEVLAGAADYDDAHGSNLIATLAVYLQTGGSPRQAAERLFVHPNTVAYRIGKVEDLIGVDLSDPEDRLLCQAAVKARETSEYRRGRARPER